MNKKQLSQVRHHLGKTQRQMAQIMGISVKSVQSFEQGWRGIPAFAERELLMMLGLKKALAGRTRPCWSVKKCSEENRRKCPVWEFGAGNICWFFNGTLCQGKAPKSWDEKMRVCQNCEVFRSVFDFSESDEKKQSEVVKAVRWPLPRQKNGIGMARR
jgi:DNA-binding XRE family transcriptional regulator